MFWADRIWDTALLPLMIWVVAMKYLTLAPGIAFKNLIAPISANVTPPRK